MLHSSYHEAYPLTPLQHGMLVHSLTTPNSGVDILQVMVTDPQPLNKKLLEKAWQLIVARHCVLRSYFLWQDLESPQQYVHPTLTAPLFYHDWTSLKEDQQKYQLQQFTQQDRLTDFDLSQAPLFRVNVFCLSAHQYQWIWTIHHALVDGRSLRIIIKEVLDCYDALVENRSWDSEKPTPFYPFIQWRAQYTRAHKADSKKFWKHYLNGITAPTQLLPSEFENANKSANNSASKATLSLQKRLSSEDTEHLKQFVKQHDITLNSVFQAAWALLLHHYSGGERDIVWGATRSGRYNPVAQSHNMVGLLINTIPMRVHLNPEHSALDLLKSLRSSQIELRPYEHDGLTDIASYCGLDHPQGLFNSVAVFENYLIDPYMKSQGKRYAHRDFLVLSQTGYPLSFVGRNDEQLLLIIQYDTALYSSDTITRILDHAAFLLMQIVQHPNTPVGRINYLPPNECHQLQQWSGADQHPLPDSIISAFQQQACQYPHREALKSSTTTLSYQELDQLSSTLAIALLDQYNIAKDQPVALYLERSVELVVIMLAVLKAGGAYVPLSASYSQERLNYMLDNLNCSFVICHQHLASDITHKNISIFPIDAQFYQSLAHINTSNKSLPKISPEQLAYVIYTSGSTGEPKGVCVPHQGVVRLVKDTNYLAMAQPGVYLHLSAISFDATTFEVWAPLLNGGRCVIYPEEPGIDPEKLALYIQRYQITTLWLTASLFNAIVDTYPKALETVKYLLTGGEALSVKHINKAHQCLPELSLINGYGPTENTTFSCCYAIPRNIPHWPSIPIGYPISHSTVYILNEQLNPVGIGVPGELYLAGKGLARCYWRAPRLTAQRFLPNPFGPSGSIMYKTGDQVRFLSDGRLEYLGRFDDQVKVRGFRIELKDIEYALLNYPELAQVCVIVRQDITHDKSIVAYYVPKNSNTIPKISSLIHYLKSKLANFMIPHYWVCMDQLPVTRNGKIDRKQLPKPNHDLSYEGEDAEPLAPSSETEKMLLALWQQYMPDAKITGNSDFFQLGGHSLLATQCLIAIRHTFQVELSLKEFYQQAQFSLMAELINIRRTAITDYATHTASITIEPRSVDHKNLIGQAQLRLWFLQQVTPNAGVYNIPSLWLFKQQLKKEVFEKAFLTILDKHEILSSYFIKNAQGDIRVEFHKSFDTLFCPVPGALHGAKFEDKALQTWLTEQADLPFDLNQPPLWRCYWLPIENNQLLILFVIHHIIFDGASLECFINELLENYQQINDGKNVESTSPTIQYYDYTYWHDQVHSESIKQKELNFWQNYLTAPIPQLELPTDFPRQAKFSYQGKNYHFNLPSQSVFALEQFCQQQGITLYLLLLSTFKLVLATHSQRSDIIVGTPVSGRDINECKNMMGFLVNTIAIFSHIDWQERVCDFLKRTQDNIFTAFSHQNLSFESIVKAINPPRDVSRTPIFQAFFGYHNYQDRLGHVGDIEFHSAPIIRTIARTDITLWAKKNPKQGLEFSLEYSTDLFSDSRIQRLAEHFIYWLMTLIQSPGAKLHHLNTVPKKEYQLILNQFNATDTQPPNQVSWLDEFNTVSRLHRDKIAVLDEMQSLSYSQVDYLSKKLAISLLKKGAKRDQLIAVMMHRSIYLPIALIAILRSGAAYLPLDPSFPKQRIDYMLDDSSCSLIITHNEFIDDLKAPTRDIFDLDHWLAQQQTDGYSLDEGALPVIYPNQRAYVIYTSGSTGLPKGVQISHQNLHNFLLSMRKKPGLSTQDTLLALTTISFDIAALELYLPLIIGASVAIDCPQAIMDNKRLGYWLDRGVSVIQGTPSFWRLLLASCDQTSLSKITALSGGEPLTYRLAKQINAATAKLWNLYGPTETTIWSSTGAVFPMEATSVTMGTAIDNTQVYILDDYYHLLPIGVWGQLYIGGLGVARGYLNKPALTAQRFIPDPFSKTPGARMYQTGDRVRFNEQGALIYGGRLDFQVKVRGHRIELKEIEKQCQCHAQIEQALVTLIETENENGQDQRLVAYYQTQGSNQLQPTELSDFLAQRLPNYMIPSYFVPINKWPLTPNGKIDQQHLPSPEPQSTHHGTVASNDTEKKLAHIWQKLLKVEQVFLEDSFFDLGGHSLLAVNLFARIKSEFNVDLPLVDLLKAPTLKSLAYLIDAHHHRSERQFSSIVTFRKKGQLTPLFCVHGVGGNVLNYRILLPYLNENQPFYGLQSQGLDGLSQPLHSVEQMANHYLKEIQAIQPHGPYYLSGGSMGGLVAFEMTRQLIKTGQVVRLLLMFDTFAPQYFSNKKTRSAMEKLHTFWRHSPGGVIKKTLSLAYKSIAMPKAKVHHKLKYLICTGYQKMGWPLPLNLRLWFVREMNLAALFQYNPDPLDCKIVLLRSTGYQNDPNLNWQHYVSDIERICIPGSHGNLVEHPLLAKALTQSLAKAQHPASKYNES